MNRPEFNSRDIAEQRLRVQNDFGAYPALVPSAPEDLRSSVLSDNDPGYGLGVYLPRTISPCAIFIASVLLWLVPLSIWAYATRPSAASAHSEHSKRASSVEAGTLHEVQK